MSQTTNLGLSLIDSADETSTNFQEWSRKLNGAGGGNSDMHKIDAEFGRIYGENGTVTLESIAWDQNGVYTLTMDSLGDNDTVFFYPANKGSKTALDSANCFVSSNGSTVTFTADTAPATNIDLLYRIVRGAK